MTMNKKYIFFLLIIIFAFGCKKEDEIQNFDKNKILDLVNEVRLEGCDCNGVFQPPTTALKWNSMLYRAAQKHSEWMFETGTFSHTGEGGSSHSERIQAEGYPSGYAGENIAWGYTSEEAVIQGWLSSDKGHCENIMNPNWEDIGIGREGNYWTMDLARP